MRQLPLLLEGNIILNQSFNDKYEAIKFTGELLVQTKYITPTYIERMLEREEVVTTYIGNHLAIPHGVNNSESEIIQSGISIVQVPEGVSFGDNKTAYMLIGIAGKNEEHLSIIQRIAIVCMDVENVIKMKNAKSKEEILEVIGMIK